MKQSCLKLPLFFACTVCVWAICCVCAVYYRRPSCCLHQWILSAASESRRFSSVFILNIRWMTCWRLKMPFSKIPEEIWLWARMRWITQNAMRLWFANVMWSLLYDIYELQPSVLIGKWALVPLNVDNSSGTLMSLSASQARWSHIYTKTRQANAVGAWGGGESYIIMISGPGVNPRLLWFSAFVPDCDWQPQRSERIKTKKKENFSNCEQS